MARVLNDRYGFSFNGIKRFFINRFLRIFPPYYFIVILSLIIIYFQPEISRNIDVYMILPDFKQLIYNLTIFGVTRSQSQIIPAAWSLRIELVYYILLALIIARQKYICFLFLICSTIYYCFLLFRGYELTSFYFTIYASSLPFCLGACAYLFENELRFVKLSHTKYIAFLFVFNMLFANLWGDPLFYGFFLFLILGFLLIIALSRIDSGSNPFIKKVDTFLGNLSYPVFLCHVFMACLIILFGLADKIGARLFIVSILPINLLSYVLYKYIEQPINNIRNKIRSYNSR